MGERAYQVFGDWRDLRSAIEACDPSWNERGDAERKALWDFANGVIGQYQPMNARCIQCQVVVPARAAYRCADCHSHLCESCIRPHFGPGHQPHGDRR